MHRQKKEKKMNHKRINLAENRKHYILLSYWFTTEHIRLSKSFPRYCFYTFDCISTYFSSLVTSLHPRPTFPACKKVEGGLAVAVEEVKAQSNTYPNEHLNLFCAFLPLLLLSNSKVKV